MSSNVDHPDPEKVKEITGIEPAELPGRDETLSGEPKINKGYVSTSPRVPSKFVWIFIPGVLQGAILFPAIQNHKRDSLKKTVTVEKNSLPDKSQIEAEKRASVSDEWYAPNFHVFFCMGIKENELTA